MDGTGGGILNSEHQTQRDRESIFGLNAEIEWQSLRIPEFRR
jgi:hypothetical protein